MSQALETKLVLEPIPSILPCDTHALYAYK